MGRLISLNRAVVRDRDAGARGPTPAFAKHAVDGALALLESGLAGDERGAASMAGGLARSLYAYPREHFPFWQTVRAQARAAGWGDVLPAGSFGENLTVAGILEDQVWVGDVLRFADCELAVSEPRLPDLAFNAAMGFEQASALMRASGWCGFYLSVRVPGRLRAGESFEVVPGPREVGIRELFISRAAPTRR